LAPRAATRRAAARRDRTRARSIGDVDLRCGIDPRRDGVPEKQSRNRFDDPIPGRCRSASAPRARNQASGRKKETELSRHTGDVRFGSSYLTGWCAKENGDRKSDGATDKNKPGPGNVRPPIWHEPSEVPLRRHEFSSEQRENIKGRHCD